MFVSLLDADLQSANLQDYVKGIAVQNGWFRDSVIVHNGVVNLKGLHIVAGDDDWYEHLPFSTPN